MIFLTYGIQKNASEIETYMDNGKVYILLLNFNGWQDTIECLESIFDQNYNNYQVIIVDNNSTDHSVSKITEWTKSYTGKEKNNKYTVGYELFAVGNKDNEIKFELLESNIFSKNLIIIKSNQNKGFSYGNNIGINYAKFKNDFENIWILNNDTIIEKNTLSNLKHEYGILTKQYKKVVLTTKEFSYYSRTKEIHSGFCYLNLLTGLVSNKSGGLLKYKYIVGSSIFLGTEVPLMDENYFLYFDDVEYTKILEQQQFALINSQNSFIYHKVNSSVKSNNNISTIYFKSLVIFFRKHYKFLLPIIYISRSFYYIITFHFKYFINFTKALFQRT